MSSQIHLNTLKSVSCLLVLLLFLCEFTFILFPGVLKMTLRNALIQLDFVKLILWEEWF